MSKFASNRAADDSALVAAVASRSASRTQRLAILREIIDGYERAGIYQFTLDDLAESLKAIGKAGLFCSRADDPHCLSRALGDYVSRHGLNLSSYNVKGHKFYEVHQVVGNPLQPVLDALSQAQGRIDKAIAAVRAFTTATDETQPRATTVEWTEAPPLPAGWAYIQRYRRHIGGNFHHEYEYVNRENALVMGILARGGIASRIQCFSAPKDLLALTSCNLPGSGNRIWCKAEKWQPSEPSAEALAIVRHAAWVWSQEKELKPLADANQ